MAGAGEHLRGIITGERRLSAADLAGRLQGMRLLTVATVTADGRPLAGPVDGYFLHGTFWFSSGRNSVRMRHLAARPAVSATHLPGEELAVTVHGRAFPIDIGAEENAGFRQTVLDIYLPRFGPEWEHDFLDSGPVYARIEAERMFTFWMPEPAWDVLVQLRPELGAYAPPGRPARGQCHSPARGRAGRDRARPGRALRAA